MGKKLDTLVNVMLNAEQVKEVVRAQQNSGEVSINTHVTMDRIVHSINRVIEMYKSGSIIIKEGKLVPKGFGYRALSELNNLEDIIMNNINIIKMPDNWA